MPSISYGNKYTTIKIGTLIKRIVVNLLGKFIIIYPMSNEDL